MLNAHRRAKGTLQGPGGLLCSDKLGGPAGSFLTSAELPFHEDCGQPFYLLGFGFPFLAALLQLLLVMLELQSAAKSPGEKFLGGI
jgi:hypothetical protein